jgi:hypothetical protein
MNRLVSFLRVAQPTQKTLHSVQRVVFTHSRAWNISVKYLQCLFERCNRHGPSIAEEVVWIAAAPSGIVTRTVRKLCGRPTPTYCAAPGDPEDARPVEDGKAARGGRVLGARAGEGGRRAPMAPAWLGPGVGTWRGPVLGVPSGGRPRRRAAAATSGELPRCAARQKARITYGANTVACPHIALGKIAGVVAAILAVVTRRHAC